MNPQSITAQLEPLRLPEAISWWPPAPGWWLVALVVLAGLVFLARLAWKFHRRGAPLRFARATLTTLRESTADLNERVTALAKLQRQLAIRIAGRRACAGLTGEPWAEFLNGLAGEGERYFDAHLAELPYRTGITQDDWNDALNATTRWLQRLERPA